MRLFASTSATTMRIRIIVFCVLSILGGWSVAMDETASSLAGGSSSSALPNSASSSLHGPRFSSLVDPRDQVLGGKRAYTYRSEFKRLPLYQFGLGKRWAQGIEGKRTQPFSFGLGKRTRQYSFGLGKRSNYEDSDDTSRYGFGYIPNDQYDAYAQRNAFENYLEAKRTGGFNFGLGKREAEINDDEKLPAKNLRDKYLFGLGKRLYEEDQDEMDEEEA
ncbi:PREDICTED: allatostatins [Ceratosolen solmsi marchali]|uniref:Allatostatins n=1 Tax=Ceratosolen solmsi marchali TaxID=326594 RepID=A0AAJ6YPP1_9HYME|nr:PREDICTED: allatostatins [Ceratosolen solmsi marchali]